MPKVTCVNPVFVRLLEEWKAEIVERNPEDSRQYSVGKAVSGIRASKEVFHTPDECRSVKGVGPKILAELKERYARYLNDSDVSEPSPGRGRKPEGGKEKGKSNGSTVPKKGGRPSKKAPATVPAGGDVDDVEEGGFPSLPHSSVIPIPRAVPRAGFSQCPPIAGDAFPRDALVNTGGRQPVVSEMPHDPSSSFVFWYIDTDKTQVVHRDKAEVIFKYGYGIWYSIEYTADQAHHPFTRSLRDIRPAPQKPYGEPATLLAVMSETDVQLRGEHCNGPFQPAPLSDISSSVTPRLPRATTGTSADINTNNTAKVPKQVKNNLADELKAEALARNKASIDPSRQPSNLPQVSKFRPATSTSASASRTLPQAAVLSDPAPSLSRTMSTPAHVGLKAESAASASLSISEGVPSAVTSGSSRLKRTESAPVPSTGQPGPPLEPAYLVRKSAGAKIRQAPRKSSHIPPPPAIDQVLEEHLNRGVFTQTMAIDDSTDFCCDTPDQSEFELPFTPIVFPRGSYDITFVLDSREVKSTKSSKDREYIQEQLAKRGVPVEKRALELGDVCWVAKRRGESGDTAEAVLDFIMERKRLDDLVGSIKDSRFHEQKFRLKQSGIGRVYYLVEEYEREVHYEHKSMDQAVFTALSSTQVVEGFFLKETRDINDTIEYLVGLHQTIDALHKDQPLYIIPPSAIHRQSYYALQTALRRTYPETPYLTSYTSFRVLNKSRSETLRDFFARMLLCISGMSAEKTATVIEAYDTPMKLYRAFLDAEAREAYERVLEVKALQEAEASGNSNGKGRKKKSSVVPASLLLTQLPGSGRRHIGDALSTKVYELFTAERY